MKRIITLVFIFTAQLVFSQTIILIPAAERIRTFDVIHLNIELDLDVEGKNLSGKVTTELTPLSENLGTVELDAVAFDILSVKNENGLELPFEYDSSKIIIRTVRNYSPGEICKVTVEYKCRPQTGMFFIQPSELDPSKPYQVWTQGEDEENRFWLPIYDYPNDKATFNLKITLDDKYKSLSNGYLKNSVKDQHSGRRTDEWVMDKPVSSYLIMIAAGDFNVIEKKYGNIPVQSYTDQNISVDDAEYTFRNVPDMADYFSKIFRYEYPWNKYAQVVVENFIYGGMENVTATVLNKRTIYNRKVENEFYPDGTIAHELSHMWWGDLVTCRNWSEIWLNESFATFSNLLWNEKYYGEDEYKYDVLLNGDDALRLDSLTGRYPIWAGYGRLTANVYDKGSVILNTFRYILGDDFYPSLGNFLKEYEFKNAETKDLMESINRTTGKDYKWMFDQWILKAGQPEFYVNYKFDEKGKEVVLNVKQLQKEDSLTPVFRVPMDILIKNKSGKKIHKIEIDRRAQEFRLDCSTVPDYVEFDHGNNILDRLYFEKPLEDWKNQLAESEDAIDRITALRGLEGFLKWDESRTAGKPAVTADQREALKLFEYTLNNDKFWGARNEAAKILGRNHLLDLTFNILKNSYELQTNTRIRREILKSAGSSGNNFFSDFIVEKIKNEENDYIVADGISALAGCMSGDKLKEFVMPYAERSSYREVVRNAVINTLSKADSYGTDTDIRNVLMGFAFGKDIDERLRVNAANSLVKYAKDPEVKDSALKYLDYNFIFVKRALINILAASGDSSLIKVFKEMINKSTDPGVKKSFEAAIKKLTS
ncbi:MAG: hypothetical protein JSS91_08845 [Bacteroidetes bacterium]|nr:hypothetical protein [Bacteroidota bacterium]